MGSVPRSSDDGGFSPLIPELTDGVKFEAIQRRLVFLAWFKYRIQTSDAHDVVQNAVTAYCEVRARYAGETNQMGILLGIFKKKCLEFLEKTKREERLLTRLGDQTDNATRRALAGAGADVAAPAVLDDLIRQEEGRLILRALADLPPDARELLNLVADETVGRQGLIDQLGMNKNTLDTRIRTARLKLKEILRARGVLGDAPPSPV